MESSIDLNDLQRYNDSQLKKLQLYYDVKLSRFIKKHKQKLSAAIAEAIKESKSRFDKMNTLASERFSRVAEEIEKEKKEEGDSMIIRYLERFAKNDLKRSLKFNKKILESDIKHFESLL